MCAPFQAVRPVAGFGITWGAGCGRAATVLSVGHLGGVRRRCRGGHRASLPRRYLGEPRRRRGPPGRSPSLMACTRGERDQVAGWAYTSIHCGRGTWPGMLIGLLWAVGRRRDGWCDRAGGWVPRSSFVGERPLVSKERRVVVYWVCPGVACCPGRLHWSAAAGFERAAGCRLSVVPRGRLHEVCADVVAGFRGRRSPMEKDWDWRVGRARQSGCDRVRSGASVMWPRVWRRRSPDTGDETRGGVGEGEGPQAETGQRLGPADQVRACQVVCVSGGLRGWFRGRG